MKYDCLHRFRRQHEQLRQVIVRVLRPVTSKQKAGTPSEEVAPKIEPVVDEAADANAIEVLFHYFSVRKVLTKCYRKAVHTAPC